MHITTPCISHLDSGDLNLKQAGIGLTIHVYFLGNAHIVIPRITLTQIQ